MQQVPRGALGRGWRFHPPAAPCWHTAGLGRRFSLPVYAAKGGSPWSTGPGARKGSSEGSSKSSNKASKRSNDSGGSSKSGGRSKSSSSSKPSKSSKSSNSSSTVPSGIGFGPQKPQQHKTPVYKLTAPLTPQLLDELSGWEMVPAPLWGTFTGHCEGEWLGQYAAYTPWGGDPEPVWADESGAYLLNAYSRASEARQQVPAGYPLASAVAAAAATAAAERPAAGADATAGQAQGSPTAAAAGRSTEERWAGDEAREEYVDMLVRTTLRSASISSLIGGTSASGAAAAAAAERTAVRTAAQAGDASAAAAGGAAAAAVAEEAAAADDEAEGFAYNRDGSVVFNGGSYSAGPEQLDGPELEVGLEQLAQDDPDTLAGLPFSTAVIEQALVAGGDVRLRLVATLKLRKLPGEQELDVEVARLLLYKEFWYGTAESTSGLTRKSQQQQQQQQPAAEPAATAAAGEADAPISSSSSSGQVGSGGYVLQLLPAHKFDVPVTDLARPQPQQLAGSWNVFVVAANPIVEENPDTLQDEEVLVYSSREERQQWHVPGLTSSAALGSSISSSGSSISNGTGARASEEAAAAAAEDLDDDGSGGSFWLPGGAVVTIRMVQWPPGCSTSSNGNGTSSSSLAHGLQVGLYWLVDGGSCLFVERQYDADGQLAEVRQGSAVKGGWSGGRM